MIPRHLALISILAGFATASVAHAQPQVPPEKKSPSPETPPDTKDDKGDKGDDEAAQRERAKPFYIDARRQHEAKEYLAAAENYLAAFREYPKAAFLYNAAQVLRLGGKLPEALEHYKKYVELEPEGEGAKYAGEFITAIEAKLKEPPPKKDPVDPVDPVDPDKGTGDASKDTVSDASGDMRPEPIPVISKNAVAAEGQNKRLIGLALAATGVVGIGIGVGFGLHARSLDKEASEFMGPFEQLEDLYERGDAADRNMVISLSAGALVAVAGGLIYYMGARDRSRAERDLEIFASPTSGGTMIGVSLTH